VLWDQSGWAEQGELCRGPTYTQKESMSTSAPLLAELDHLLQQEVEAYEHLLALHQEVQRCLAAPVLDPLLASLQAREHVARHIAHLEHQRTAVTAQLAPLLQLPAADVTLQNLSTRVDAPYASRLRQYRTRLRTLVDEVQQLNSVQAQLLCEVRAFVDAALAFFTGLLPAQPTYLQSGKLTTPTPARFLSGRV
jgi:phosphoglycerate-specific signal transduction histidine kinase